MPLLTQGRQFLKEAGKIGRVAEIGEDLVARHRGVGEGAVEEMSSRADKGPPGAVIIRFGAHGHFDDRARVFSWQMSIARHRAAAALGVVGLGVGLAALIGRLR